MACLRVGIVLASAMAMSAGAFRKAASDRQETTASQKASHEEGEEKAALIEAVRDTAAEDTQLQPAAPAQKSWNLTEAIHRAFAKKKQLPAAALAQTSRTVVDGDALSNLDAESLAQVARGTRVVRSDTETPISYPYDWVLFKDCEGQNWDTGLTFCECKEKCDRDPTCTAFGRDRNPGFEDWCMIYGESCAEKLRPRPDRFLYQKAPSYNFYGHEYCEERQISWSTTPRACRQRCDADPACSSYGVISQEGKDAGFANGCFIFGDCAEGPLSNPHWDRLAKAPSYAFRGHETCEDQHLSWGTTPSQCKQRCDADYACGSYGVISKEGRDAGFANGCFIFGTEGPLGCGVAPPLSNPAWDRLVKDAPFRMPSDFCNRPPTREANRPAPGLVD